MSVRHAVICGTLSVWMGACANNATLCEQASVARDFARASVVCAAAFEKTDDPRAGIYAAMAALQLGQDDQAVKLAELLLSTSQRATALRIIGLLRAKTGDAIGAQTALQESLQLHLASGDALEIAKAAHTLAGQRWKAGAYGEALDALALAQTQAALAKDSRLSGFVSMALGDLFYEVGDLGSAERALAKASDALSSASPGDWAYVRFKEGLIHHDAGRQALAQAAYAHALELAEPVQRHDLIRAVHLRWAELDWQAHRWEDAERHLNSAQRMLDAREDAEARTAWWYLRGVLSQALGRTAEAAASLDAALSHPCVPERRWRILNARAEVAESLGDEARALKDYAEAMDVIEGLRSGANSDELRTWLAATKRSPYEALFLAHARARRVSAALEVMAKLQTRALGDAFLPTATSATPVVPGVADAEVGKRRFLALKRFAFPQLQVPLQLTVPPRSVVWAFVRARDEWWRAELEQGHARLESLGPAASLQPWIETLRKNPRDVTARGALGQRLLPSSGRRAKNTRLFVIPDEGLTGISFASLFRPGGEAQGPLRLSYVPSVTVLWGMHQREMKRPAVSSLPKMFVFGDPKGDLPGSAQEAWVVAKALGAQARVGSDVTRKALQLAQDAQVLHLSSHAGVSAEGAWLELSDGRLDVADVRDLQLHPTLAVLASCASAIGRAPALTGAMSWAFLMSGSRNVVATLRAVDDQSSARFMADFYRAGGARDPAVALHRVQSEWAKRDDSGDWSAFALFGLQ